MTRHRTVLALALLLAGGVLMMRLCRETPSPPPPPEPDPVEIEIPELPPPPPPPPEPLPVSEEVKELDPARLLAFLEKLGRAYLLKDHRRLKELREKLPAIYESDIPWLRARLTDELFVAAGAVDMMRWHRVNAAIPELGEVLSHPSHPFLKDLVIDTLAALGGDSAAVVLLAALRSDPDESVRARVASRLSRFGGPEIYHGLIAALQDPRPSVRIAASHALSRMESQDVVKILLGSLSNEQDPQVQADIVMASWPSADVDSRAFILDALRNRRGAWDVLKRRTAITGKGRYGLVYPKDFFEPGGLPVSYAPPGRRIGINVEVGSAISLQEVAAALFSTAPLDRYRDWFYFRRVEEFPSTQAYDSYGKSMGLLQYSELDGTIYIRFKNPESFDEGVLGYTRGCEAFVTRLSLLHEVGHAFAQLADEYPEGSTREAANLSKEQRPPWAPLNLQGHLDEIAVDRGDGYSIPTGYCHMSNLPVTDRFCPVCQLEILAKLAELAAAPVPWVK